MQNAPRYRHPGVRADLGPPGVNAPRYQSLSGHQIIDRLEPLADLRLRVFRDWPYLYEGTLDYERHYLGTYVACPDSLAVLAWDGDRCVGVTTALPMTKAPPEMRAPFEQAGLPVEDILYFGESVVLADYRGRGIGVHFFELREAHARALGLAVCAFCAVDRPEDHPRKPADYLGNDRFWERRGYTRRPDLACRFDWQDLDQPAPTSHRLTFWTRTL